MKRTLILTGTALILITVTAMFFFNNSNTTALTKDVYMSQLMQSPEAVLIDFRTPQEYASGHIPGARNIDFYGATFEEQIRALDTAKTYYVYCRSGSRSRQAQNTMRAAGITQIFDLRGGIAGNPDLMLQAGSEAGERIRSDAETVDTSDIIPTSLPTKHDDTTLSESERAGLVYMYEEEKLARDVYTTLGAQWNVPIFANIAESEKTHMAAVGRLLERYQVPNPTTEDITGVFHDVRLQQLYATLVERGSASAVEALTVGALIEDLDIADLDRYMQETENSDINAVYAELQRGSRNHLRAFTRQLNARGASYEPQYISRDTYDAIIQSGTEKGKGWW